MNCMCAYMSWKQVCTLLHKSTASPELHIMSHQVAIKSASHHRLCTPGGDRYGVWHDQRPAL